MSLTIWCNAVFAEPARHSLLEAVKAAGHALEFAAHADPSVLAPPKTGAAALARVDVVFGQPQAEACLVSPRVRWIALTSAGYTRFDTPETLDALRTRDVALTNASAVFADPCAQHALAMMLALGRNLLPSYRDQLGDHAWAYEKRRATATLLTGQTVLLLGFGAIGRRLAELLAPFGVKLIAVRRRAYSERGVHVISEEKITSALAEADHVVNILPDNEATRNYVNARRLAACKPGARFYNVGRGTTVDQRALQEALESGRLGAAYLDVTDPEPLPPEHALWTTPHCFITPHSAGGRSDQDAALVKHFLANLAAFEKDAEGMVDRVV